MRNPHYKTLALAGLSVVTAVGLSACSNDGSTSSSPAQAAPMTTSVAMTPAASALVGPGCSSYAQQVPTGPGSIEGMAQDPVAVAASNNPMPVSYTHLTLPTTPYV